MSTNAELKMFSEVYAIIEVLGDSYKKRLPKELYEIIKRNKDDNYIVKFKFIEELDKKMYQGKQ